MMRLSLFRSCFAVRLRASICAVLAALCLIALAGCGGTVAVANLGSSGTTTSPVDYTYITGNWEFQITPASGTTAPFTTMAGFINEQGQSPGTFDESTAVFQIAPDAGCYAGATVVPMSGAVEGTVAKYGSFSVNGQYLSLNLAKDSTATHLTGTYRDSGGCVKGVNGTILGTRYVALTGSYVGNIDKSSPAISVTLNLTQGGQGTGSGVTEVIGNGSFVGFPCFSRGALQSPTSYVLGGAVTLTFATNDPTGAQAILTGSFDQTAHTVSIDSIQVTGGSCSGTYGTATLERQ